MRGSAKRQGRGPVGCRVSSMYREQKNQGLKGQWGRRVIDGEGEKRKEMSLDSATRGTHARSLGRVGFTQDSRRLALVGFWLDWCFVTDPFFF